MHLRNIFAKTGARRQGELVALLLKSIGLGPRVK
jgi:DNA-binding CsgD family transcriptional regulator